ncbi:MAG: Gldg family protein [Clostridiales bacterium]|jgi:ABC-2 type transport system permease protein|nr:Gldg family protein [Clostridiales bacterium]
MFAIYKRELHRYFTSLLGWVFLGFSAIIFGIFFTIINIYYQIADLENFFDTIGIVLLFFVPILTMQLIAEEHRSKTDQLLLTSPIKPGAIIMGKFFAVLTLFAASLMIIVIYIIMLCVVADPPIANSISMLIGYFLMGASLISLGMFASSLTQNSIIAAVISFSLLLILWLGNAASSVFYNSWIAKVIEWVSVLIRFEDFVGGQLLIMSLVYFISFTAIFLYCTTVRLRGKHVKGFVKKSVVALVVISIIAGNVVADYLLNKYKVTIGFDLTTTQIYQISDETKAILSKLNNNIKITVFMYEGNNSVIDSVVQKYADNSNGKVTYEYVNPEENPAIVKQFSDAGANVESGSVAIKNTDTNAFRLIQYSDFTIMNAVYGTVTGLQIEPKITSAILGVTEGGKINVGLTINHGEIQLDTSGIGDVLSDNNIETFPTNLLNDNLPDVNVIMILAPTTDFTSDEIARLSNFVNSGKGVQVMVDPGVADLPNLFAFMQQWGLKFNNDLVIETDYTMLGSNSSLSLIPKLLSSDMTKALLEANRSILFPQARSVSMAEITDTEVIQRPLLQTSDVSYAKTDLNFATAEQEEHDTQGPLYVAGLSYKVLDLAEKPYTESEAFALQTGLDPGVIQHKKSSVIAYGGSSFISLQNIQTNKDLILNSLNWQAGVGSQLNVQPKSLESTYIQINNQQMIIMAVIALVVLPIGLFLTGIIVFIRRKIKTR